MVARADATAPWRRPGKICTLAAFHERECASPIDELAGGLADGRAFDAVIEASYAQLRGMAAERLARVDAVTWTAHDLLHEALARVMQGKPELVDRAHFFATLSLLMRSIVVDHARARAADKRGGGAQRVTLTDGLSAGDGSIIDVLELDQALTRLAAQDARGSEVLHLTYFAGLRQDEIAGLLQVSVKTIERDLRFARAWLHDALGAR